MFGYYNYFRAEDEFKLGNYRNAIEKYNKAITSGALNATETYNAYCAVGSCFINLGDYDEAIKAFNSALQWDRNQYLAYHKLGTVYYNKFDYEQSLQYFEKAIELNSNDFESWEYKGYVLEKLERYDDAENALKTALNCTSPSDLGIINNVLFIISLKKNGKKATELQENGKYADAIKIYDSILESIDSNSHLLSDDEVDQILADSMLNKDLCLKALKNYEQFIVSLKKNGKKATELQENGKYTDAIKVYDSVLESISSNSNTESFDDINQIHADSLLNKGKCLMTLKRYDGAIYVLQELLDLVPNSVTAYANIAECYYSSKKYDEALEYYTKADNCSEDDEEKITINLMKKLIIIDKLWLIKDYQAALTEANSMSEENDHLRFVKKAITGTCHFYLENYDEALNYLLPYVDADWLDFINENKPIRGMVYTYVGGVYYKRKNYETALKYLKKCDDNVYSEIADTGLFIGECYIALGEYEKAIDALRKAIEAWGEEDNYDIPYLESRIQFAKEKLAEVKAKVPPSHIIINGNNNPINLGGILATDDAVINRPVIGKDSAQEENDVCFCPYCGTKINADFMFCPKCGRKLNED